jgi:hypothetical protein
VVAHALGRIDGCLETVEPVCIQKVDDGRDGLDGVFGHRNDCSIVVGEPTAVDGRRIRWLFCETCESPLDGVCVGHVSTWSRPNI